MVAARSPLTPLAGRARDWHHRARAAVCDVIEPWEHGTVLRATRYPTYYDYNVVRVEQETGLDAAGLTAVAEQALAGLGHRLLDFELIGEAESLRPAFAAGGWKTMRLLWMRHERPLPPGAEVALTEVDYDEVHDLRLTWHLEERSDCEWENFFVAAKEVAISRGARVLALRAGRSPVGYVQLEYLGEAAEISSVYVHPEHRGRGIGTAMTRAAIRAAGEVPDLWIVADDEDRPKQLYARLGFRPAWTTMDCLLLA